MGSKDALGSVIKQVNKVFGKGTLMKASKAKSLVVDRFNSGIFILDMKMGNGYPRGRIITIKGNFSTGKSAVAMLAVAQAQSTCRYCGKLFERVDLLGEYHSFNCKCKKNEPMRVVWVDAEHSLDPLWAEKWGVNTEKLYIIQTEYAEQAVDITDLCIRSKECDLVVVDSVAAMTPGVEVEESSTKQQIGVMAKLMNKALRKWTSGMNSMGLLADTKCTIILINQERTGIGQYSAAITSPGGRGIDFFESVEIRLKKKNILMSKVAERPIGVAVEFEMKKNKTAPLSDSGEFELYFVTDKGNCEVGTTNTAMQVLTLAVYWNLLVKDGSWIKFPDGSKAQGFKKAAVLLNANPELLLELESNIRKREVMWAEEGDLGERQVDEEDTEDAEDTED